MAINSIHASHIETYAARAKPSDETKNTSAAARKSKRDEVTLSPEARQLQRILKEVHKADDVRSELVQRLKNEIASGTYKIDAEKLADKLLGLDG